MTPLGRGLASLIPRRRDDDDAEDLLDRIDAEDEGEEVIITSREETVTATSIPVMDEEQEESQEEELLERPVKPLVTLLDMSSMEDEDTEEELDFTDTKSVQVTEDEESSFIEVGLDDDDDNGESVEVEQEEESSVPVEIEETEEAEEVVITEEPQNAADDEEDDEEEEPEVEEDIEDMTQPPVEDTEKEEQESIEGVSAPSFDEGGGAIWNQHEEKIVHIPLGDIKVNPLQPRRSFDQHELDELKDSISKHGILQPLVVRRMGEDSYELIAGERRFRSAKELKWDRVPCVVRVDVKSDQSRLVFALIENIQRENLNPIEEALAYQQLNKEYGLTHEEIGERVGKSRVGITNVLRVLQLPAEIQRGIVEGKITLGHAKAILMIPDEEKQIRFYQHLVDEGITVRKAETRARRIQRAMNVSDSMERRRRGKHPLALRYIPPLEDRFGYDANIKYLQEKNQFEVVFRAHTDKDVEELLGRLLGTEPLPTDEDILGREHEEEEQEQE